MRRGTSCVAWRENRLRPFRYRDPGNMATIGRANAIADFGWTRVSGFAGWLLWLFVHILFLVGFRNRLSVLLQWGASYLTYQRSVRLITGADNNWRVGEVGRVEREVQGPHSELLIAVPATSTRPGSAVENLPSSRTSTPLTTMCVMPSASW